MRVLVTGGAGFIGSHVADALMAKGYDVTVLDNLSNGREDNLRTHLGSKHFKFIKGDIRNQADVRKVLAGVDAVVHGAAMISVPVSVEHPELAHEINVEGTQRLLETSAKTGVSKFVLASSCAVYGEQEELPIPEDAPLRPLSPYAKSKLEAENLCSEFFGREGLSTVCLRYFNVYGPRQSAGEYAGVMIKFIERLQSGQPPIIYGSGEQTRDFVYIGDVAEATVRAIEREGVSGEVINIGTGVETSINELCGVFLKQTEKNDLRPLYELPRKGDIERSQADISKARRLLGFKPKVSLMEGVRKLLESGGWFG